MKIGNKDSALSEIPKSWEVVSLENVCDVIDPHPSHRAPMEDANGYPFVGIGDISENGTIDIHKARKISLEDVEKQKITFELEDHDMGFGRVASIGKVVWFKKQNFPYAISPTMALIKAKKVVPQFCYHYLSSSLVTDQFRMLSVGSTRTSIGMKSLRTLKFVVPTEPEQQKIAEILSTVDDKIEVIDLLIIETQTLKKGLMQCLLTKGIGHTEFKDSSLGMIPKSWEVVKFENILREGKGSLGYGILQPGEGVSEGINMVRTVDLTEVGRAKTEILKVPESISKTSLTTVLEGGEILLSVMGTLGRTFVVPNEWKGWNVNRALAVIRTNKKIDNFFLCHFFRSPYFKRVIDKQSLGSAQMRINLNDLRKYDVPLPSIDEQLYISTQLSFVDDKLEILKEKKETFQELKQGLMQQLLTGKIRVKV